MACAVCPAAAPWPSSSATTRRRPLTALPPSATDQIWQWADAHHRRPGDWPTATSGIIAQAGGEKWQAVATALRHGTRGFPGGSSLARLLSEQRGVRNRKQLPP